MDDLGVNRNENKWQKYFSCTTAVFAIWLLLTGLSFAAVIITVVHASRLPDFSEPHKGFETRCTVLASRVATLDDIAAASRSSGFLTSNPEGRRLLQNSKTGPPLSAWLKVPFHTRDDGEKKSPPRIHTHVVMVNPENSTKKYPSRYQHTLAAAEEDPIVPLLPRDNFDGVSAALPQEMTGIAGLKASLMGLGEVAEGRIKMRPTSEERPKSIREENNDVGTVTTADHEHDVSDEDDDEEGSYGTRHNHSHSHKHSCSQPSLDHARLVVSHKQEGLDMWNMDVVRELCQLSRELEPMYEELCEIQQQGQCCPAWSLPFYLTVASNHSSCDAITQENLNSTRDLLEFCSPHFHNLDLECMEGEGPCQFAPDQCTQGSVVRSLMNYVLDTNFLPPNHPVRTTVRRDLHYVQIILPIARSTRSLEFYHRLQRLGPSRFSYIKIVGMDLGLKNFLFDALLVNDSLRVGLACLLVMTLLLLVTVRCATLVLLGLLNIFLSLALSYWLYCEVLGAQKFPFLNLLAVLLLLAVGTDDVLFIAQGWGERCDKRLRDKVCALTSLWLSVTATSITTAGAMFAGRLSSVTSIALFSIFAGSTMLVHLGMTLLWLLPSVILVEKLASHCKIRSIANVLHPIIALNLPTCVTTFLPKVTSLLKARLLWIVSRIPFLCILVMGLCTVAASYALLVSPRLQAPDSKSFALFKPDHPFERYESDFAESFWFERRQHSSRDSMSLTWVWGVKPYDSRDFLDPLARPNGSALKFDNTFDITKPKSQTFLLRFCRQLKRQPFYKSTLGPLLPNCFLESLTTYMSRRCFDPIDNINRKPCCEASKFPYSAPTFTKCLQQAMKDYHSTPSQYYMPGLAGPKFDTRTNLSSLSAPKIIVIQFDSSRQFSLSHDDMKAFYDEVEHWTKKILQTAPHSMKNGFFISDLKFYDLQDHLMRESILSTLVAAGITCLVLYVTTRNFIITILAVVTVYSTITSSLATLALVGWRLNILESLAVTMASGLSVDYVLHYAIKINAHLEKETRMKYLIHKNLKPIFIATLTTLLTGVILLSSDILAFNQIGIFIIILTLNSFIFANFGFLSLLYKFGPSFRTDYEFCRFLWTFQEVQDETNITSQAPLSDSNSVTLSGLPPLSPELHELENMSPTFLGDPAPGTNIFDTPVVPDRGGARTEGSHQPKIAILEPLLEEHVHGN